MTQKETALNYWHEALCLDPDLNEIFRKHCPTPENSPYWPCGFFLNASALPVYASESARILREIEKAAEKYCAPANDSPQEPQSTP